MLPTFAFVIALNLCPKTKLINVTPYPWNEFDTATLRIANKRCGELYPNSRCVKMFRKWGERDYSVICGRDR